MAQVETKATVIYGIDDVPPPAETVVLGLQHYLTMFGSTVAIPLLLADHLGMKDDPVALGWLRTRRTEDEMNPKPLVL